MLSFFKGFIWNIEPFFTVSYALDPWLMDFLPIYRSLDTNNRGESAEILHFDGILDLEFFISVAEGGLLRKYNMNGTT